MQELKDNRKLLLLEGIVFLILGVLAISLPAVFTFGVEQLVGWIFLISGLFQGYRAYVMRHSPGLFPSILGSLVGVIIGLLLIIYPWTGVLTITILITLFLLSEGAIKIAFAMTVRRFSSWGWILLTGIVALLLGVLIMSGLPGTAMWMLGLIVGINMIFIGYSMIILYSELGNPPPPVK